jgi:hypothetical protein
MREALRFHEFRDASITSETTDALIDKLMSRLEHRNITETSQLEIHALLGSICCLLGYKY